ncbi:MAG: hypothetical protein HY000_17990 [Planctomycetes bacterium]|nr:hypothetical protein [Planctomycetota bacterium]
MVPALRNTRWMGIGGLLGLIVALLAFALVLTLLSTGTVGGAEFSKDGAKPDPLPAPSVELRTAVDAFRARDWNGAVLILRMLPQPLPADLDPAAVEAPLRIWSILITQAAGDRELGLARWAEIRLSPETEIWRHVAIAAANLQQLQLDEAATALSAAGRLNPHNPLVRYYTGLYLLERAEAAHDWPDALAIYDARLVAFSPEESAQPPWIMPNSASMLRLSAIQELEGAIAHQDEIDLAQPLVPATTGEEQDLLPTVHDLLLACGGDRFVADAHSIVSYLYLDRGNADAAEQHLDLATAGGASVIYGYDDLARAYEKQGRYLSAARAAAKCVQHGPGRAGAMMRMFKDLGRALQEGQSS